MSDAFLSRQRRFEERGAERVILVANSCNIPQFSHAIISKIYYEYLNVCRISNSLHCLGAGGLYSGDYCLDLCIVCACCS